MNLDSVIPIANALLYEGYLLYPYRRSSIKNQQPWTFGSLSPAAHMQTECLLLGDTRTQVEVCVRFLHQQGNEDSEEPVLREVFTSALTLNQTEQQTRFAFQAVEGIVDVAAESLDDGVFKLRVRVENQSAPENGPSLLSCQAILGIQNGSFLSMQNPPQSLREAANRCRNIGVWPVLVGEPGQRAMMLAAPIILDDYPKVAPQSPGDLFDGTEIDELLTLRIQTLTPQEKQELDPRGQALLQRSEAMTGEQLLNLHGTWNQPMQSANPPFRPGMRVRLHPRGRADVLDLALAGKTAVIVSIEHDLENQVYVSVAIDDDPGRDFGLAGRPGHRFFFRPEEVELLPVRVLIAGIGNIFFGDDAFGVEVVKRLNAKLLPVGVEAKDFGIRGFDLACALQADYDAVILVDAIQRGSLPGTLHVLEPDTELMPSASAPEMHQLDPVQVFQLVKQMGGSLPALRLVGCEPANLEPVEGEIACLSEPVERAIPLAIQMIEALTTELLARPGRRRSS